MAGAMSGSATGPPHQGFEVNPDDALCNVVQRWPLSTYEGQATGPPSNKREGWGKMAWTDGTLYEGEWLADEQTGWGTLTFGNGRMYEGQMQANAFHGQGTFHAGTSGWLDAPQCEDGYEANSVYRGGFHRDKRHGKGILTVPSPSDASLTQRFAVHYDEGKLLSRQLVPPGETAATEVHLDVASPRALVSIAMRVPMVEAVVRSERLSSGESNMESVSKVALSMLEDGTIEFAQYHRADGDPSTETPVSTPWAAIRSYSHNGRR